MTQEEKAKAYDKAYKKVAVRFGSNVADEIFPELKESEDERIRKMLIEQMKRWHECALENNVVQDIKDSADAITWLEKQGKNNMGISEATKKKLEDNLNKALEKETPESFNEFLDEQKPAWSEEDIVAIDCAVDVLSKDLPSLATSIERLKSLRPQNTWKPSNKQMKALDIAIRCGIQLGSWEEGSLKSLKEQLKKLREE